MERPIFIIGCPRSGTTVTLEIIARHEELAWVSNHINRKPCQLNIARLNQVYDLPFIGEFLYSTTTQRNTKKLPDKIIRAILPAPAEPWDFWNSYLHNFRWKRGGPIPPRRRDSHDISLSEIEQIRETVATICQYQHKKRFVSKYTDLPRMVYLSAAFPDALFIHILRDGRAVTASYLEKVENGEFKTWEEREWWIKGWPEIWRNEWLSRYNTPFSFLAFQWKFFIDEIWADAKVIGPQRYLEVRYKDIVNDPYATFERIFDFCSLGKSQRVETYLNKIDLRDKNYKWQKKFTAEEQAILNAITGEDRFKQLLDNER